MALSREEALAMLGGQIPQQSAKVSEQPAQSGLSREEALQFLQQPTVEEKLAKLSQSEPSQTTQFIEPGAWGRTKAAAESLGRGALQDYLNIGAGFGNLIAKIESEFSPKLKRELHGQAFMRAPNVISRAQVPALAQAGQLLDPLLWIAPELKGAQETSLLGKILKGTARAAAPAALMSGLESAGRTGEVRAAPFEVGGVAGTTLGAGAKGLEEAGVRLSPLMANLLKSRIASRTGEILDTLKGGSEAGTVANDIAHTLKQEYLERQGNLTPEDYIYRAPHESVGALYDKFHELSLAHPTYQPITTEEINAIKKGEISPEELFSSKEPLPRYDMRAVSKQLENTLSPLKKRKKLGTATVQQRKVMSYLKPFENEKINNFSDAANMKQAINEQIKALPVGDSTISNLEKLKSSVRQSMQDTAKGNPLLKDALLNADQQYAKQVVPFKKIAGTKKATPFWKWYAYGEGEPSNILSHYVKGGKEADRVGKLNELFKLLPNDNGISRRQVAYWWLKDTEGDPAKMIDRWNKLGTAQKRQLLPEFSDELDQLSKLKAQSPKAFEQHVSHPLTIGTFPFQSAEAIARTGLSALSGLSREKIEKDPILAEKLIENIVQKQPLRGTKALPLFLRRAAPAAGIAFKKIGFGGL